MEKNAKVKKRGSEGSQLPWPVRFGSKMALGLVVIVVFLTVVQCNIKKPESPEWNTTFNVPVLNRTYGMEEIIRKIDQDGIAMDADSNIVYSVTYDVDTVTLDESNLSTTDLTYSISEQLGPIDLSAPQMAPVATSVGDIGPLAAGIPGVVPAASFSLSHEMPPMSSFTSADISSGDMYVVIDNQLGVNLTTVDIEVYDIVNAVVVSNSSFPSGVPNGVKDSILIPLSGKSISNQLEVRADCNNASATVLSASQQLTTDINFPNGLTVSSAVAQVPALAPISFSEQADLGDPGTTEVVHEASLSSGTINLTIDNNTALDATLDISLPDLLAKSDDSPLEIQQAVSANSSGVVSLDISSYDLKPRDLTAPQVIDVEVTATVPGSGTSSVAVSQSDDFSVTAQIGSLQFDQVTGVFDATEASFDPFVEDIDIPEGFDGVGLVSSILTLEIENNVELTGSLDLLLTDGGGRSISVVGDVAAGTADSAVTTVITVVDSAFLNPVPSSIVFSGTATFGDGLTVGTISANDWVFASVELMAPMAMVLTETTFETEIEAEDINQDDIDLITEHVIEGSFTYHIVNHMPIGVEVGILMGGDTTRLPGDSNHVIPTYSLAGEEAITVSAAWADPTTGIVPTDSSQATGERAIRLTSEDIRSILEHDTLFIEPQVVLKGSDGQVVKLTNNDYLSIYGVIQVVYRFDGDF